MTTSNRGDSPKTRHQRAGEKKVQISRQAALAAAVELLQEFGDTNGDKDDFITLAAIAERAGVSVPTVLKHFTVETPDGRRGSKKALLIEARSWMSSQDHSPVRGAGGVTVLRRPAETHEDPDQTIIGQGSRTLLRDRVGPEVIAAKCINNHPNRPRSRTCRICGEPVAWVCAYLPRPPLGTLVFTEAGVQGRRVEVITDIAIGRDQGSIEAALSAEQRRRVERGLPVCEPLIFDDSTVSRFHLEIASQGWDTYIRNRSETQGALVTYKGDERPAIEISAGDSQYYPIEDGARVQLTESLSFVLQPVQVGGALGDSEEEEE
jgi:hypothetical protein